MRPAIHTWTLPISSSWSIVRVADGDLFKGVLVSFADLRTLAVPGNVTAKIHWGDGKVSAGVIAFDPAANRLKVSGQHTYVDEGPFTIKTTITDIDNGHNLGGSLDIVLTDVTVG
jgi:hypothetical protein